MLKEIDFFKSYLPRNLDSLNGVQKLTKLSIANFTSFFTSAL